MADYAARRRKLSERIEQDAFIAYNYENSDRATLRFLTGFTGEGVLIVRDEETLLLTDSRYTEQAQGEAPGITIEETRMWTGKGAAEALDALGVKNAGFSARRSAHSWVETMGKEANAELVSLKDPVAELRRVKDQEEISALRRAAAIADEALSKLVGEIRVGMTEAEVALRLEWLIRTHPEAEHIAFELNVSAGPNTALNHYDPFLDPQPLKPGDLLLFDFGASVDGYRSDITRTFSVGNAHEKSKEIYALVLEANQAAIAAAQPGMSGVELDAVARDVIVAAEHGERFGHGLGHGIGLEVHEAPSLSPRSEDTLEAGMVATIEPGVYIPGFGGVRIEDDVVFTDGGCDVITASPKDRLIEVG
jgi:Xaa-Pro aminopeptidase